MRKFRFLLTAILSILLTFSLTACGGGGDKTDGGDQPSPPPAEVFNEVTEDVASVYNKFASAYRNSDVFNIYDYYEKPIHFSYDLDYKATFTDLISKGSNGCEETMDWTGESVVTSDANYNPSLLYKEAILADAWGFDVYGSEAKQFIQSKKYSYYRNNYVYNSTDNVTASKQYNPSMQSSIIYNRPGSNLTSRFYNVLLDKYKDLAGKFDSVKVYLNEDGNTLKLVVTKAISFEDIRDYTVIDGNKYVSTYKLESRKHVYSAIIVNNYEMTLTLSLNANELGEFTSLNYMGLDVKTIEDNDACTGKYKLFSSVNTTEKVVMLSGAELEFPQYILDLE